MKDGTNYIGVDLGAESGRVMLGMLFNGQLDIREIHRFSNGPVEDSGRLRWDFATLMREMKFGIRKACRASGATIRGIGIDSWGVDFGLLDEAGELIEPPWHYRDARTNGMMEEAFRRMPREEIYRHTGIQFMQINTLYQLLAMRLEDSPTLRRAHRMGFIADLATHALTGDLRSEYTLASTSQMMNMRDGSWADPVLEALELPKDILPDVVHPATCLGTLSEKAAKEIGCGPLPVVAVASHDTGSAVAAVPASGDDWAYLSSGTWSLLGAETHEAVITPRSCELSFTNEGGIEGSIRLLKNISGLWLVQECRREWKRSGGEYSYSELTELAAKARPFARRIDPGRSEFISPGDMPTRINAYLAETGQEPLRDRGTTIRSILEALAFAYRMNLEHIEELTGRSIGVLHIVGGGMKNELLNQFAANATGRKVVTGPAEATSIGNVLAQARAMGDIESLESMRDVARRSTDLKEYAPEDVESWSREYAAWRENLEHA